MKEPRVKEVVEWIVNLCEGKEDDKLVAIQKLEALPIGYFEDHSIPRTKIKHCVNSLPDVLHSTKSVKLKEWCTHLIGEFRICTEKAIQALQTALLEDSVEVKTSAVWALGEIKPKDELSVRLLAQQAQHPDKEVRWRVAWALLEIGCFNEFTAEVLTKMLEDTDELCRGYALLALDKHTYLNGVQLRKVVKLTQDVEAFPRETAKQIMMKYQNLSNR